MVTDLDEAPDVTGDEMRDYPENGTGPVATYTATDPEMSDGHVVAGTGDGRRRLHDRERGAELQEVARLRDAAWAARMIPRLQHLRGDGQGHGRDPEGPE